MATGTRTPPIDELRENTWFKRDDQTESAGKNTVLAALLQTLWNPLPIVRIERIEIGADKGWKIVYRS